MICASKIMIILKQENYGFNVSPAYVRHDSMVQELTATIQLLWGGGELEYFLNKYFQTKFSVNK